MSRTGCKLPPGRGWCRGPHTDYLSDTSPGFQGNQGLPGEQTIGSQTPGAAALSGRRGGCPGTGERELFCGRRGSDGSRFGLRATGGGRRCYPGMVGRRARTPAAGGRGKDTRPAPAAADKEGNPGSRLPNRGLGPGRYYGRAFVTPPLPEALAPTAGIDLQHRSLRPPGWRLFLY